MSARQPFFPVRPSSEVQGTAQGFNRNTFLIDQPNPLHPTSIPATNQLESTKTAFSIPGPFSSNGTNTVPQVKTSGLGGLSKKKSAHNLNMSQSVQKDRKGSLNPPQLLDNMDNTIVRPGTADPRSEVHRDRENALEAQHGYQKASRRSLGLLDASSIARPGTAIPQSRALQDYAAGLDIRAPIPQPATLASSSLLSRHTFLDKIPDSDAHISTTDTKNRIVRKVDDVGDSTFHSSITGSAVNQIGPQRVSIEQQFGQGNTSEDLGHLNTSMTGHEVTADGRLKMSATKKRNRDEIEDGDGSYWTESQAKRHKGHHLEEFETRGYTKPPPFSPRPERASSRASHPEGDARRHLPGAGNVHETYRYKERRTISPVDERRLPPYEPPQAEQAAPDDAECTFDKLLGRNTDIFLKQNMDKYDRLVNKWSECSEEEWIAGGEVVAEMYAKIISYVKDAMISKINAYANIQVDISQHLSDLGDRDQLLDATKKKLIKESGIALG